MKVNSVYSSQHFQGISIGKCSKKMQDVAVAALKNLTRPTSITKNGNNIIVNYQCLFEETDAGRFLQQAHIPFVKI